MNGTRWDVSVPWSGTDRGGDVLALREATRRDAPRYLEHLQQLVVQTPFMLQSTVDPLPSLSEEKDILEEYERRSNCVCILAVRPGVPGRQAVIGSVTLVGGRGRRTCHSAELAMGVSQQAWGRGIGGLLLDTALTWARSSPMLARVSLQVFSTNVVALGLYRSRGFVEEGILRRFAKWEGRYDDLVGMSIPAGPAPGDVS